MAAVPIVVRATDSSMKLCMGPKVLVVRGMDLDARIMSLAYMHKQKVKSDNKDETGTSGGSETNNESSSDSEIERKAASSSKDQEQAEVQVFDLKIEQVSI